MRTVSVCISVFGFSEYLEEQLSSIFAQSYKITELVVAEDYSNLASPREFIESLCLRHEVSLNYTQLEVNVGPAEAFRIACARSNSDIVFLCDHDDIWAEGRVSLAIEKHNDHDLVVCNGRLFTDPSELDGATVLPEIYESKPASNLLGVVLKNRMVGATMSVNGALIRTLAKNFEFTPMHDWNLAAYFALRNKSFFFVEESLVMYRRHGSTFTGRSKNSVFRKVTLRLMLLSFIAQVLKQQIFGGSSVR